MFARPTLIVSTTWSSPVPDRIGAQTRLSSPKEGPAPPTVLARPAPADHHWPPTAMTSAPSGSRVSKIRKACELGDDQRTFTLINAHMGDLRLSQGCPGAYAPSNFVYIHISSSSEVKRVLIGSPCTSPHPQNLTLTTPGKGFAWDESIS
ncbi:hypothetical protein VTI28DRAFT_9780 [Corynascus sepedonium]